PTRREAGHRLTAPLPHAPRSRRPPTPLGHARAPSQAPVGDTARETAVQSARYLTTYQSLLPPPLPGSPGSSSSWITAATARSMTGFSMSTVLAPSASYVISGSRVSPTPTNVDKTDRSRAVALL